MPTAYISDDPNLVEVLKVVTDRLETAGWRVMRGPKATPGTPYRLERVMQGKLPLYTKNPAIEPAWRERLSRLAAGA